MKMETNEAQLLEDLMNESADNVGSGFSDQWNKAFGTSNSSSSAIGPATGPAAAGLQLGEPKKPSSNDIDDEFSNFVSSSGLFLSNQTQTGSDLLGLDEKPVQPFLTSQLFDLDQSLYSKQSSSVLSKLFVSSLIYTLLFT